MLAADKTMESVSQLAILRSAMRIDLDIRAEKSETTTGSDFF